MQIEAAPRRTSGQGAADRGEYRQAAGAIAEAQATVCQGNMLTTRQCFLRGSNTRIIGLGRFLVL